MSTLLAHWKQHRSLWLSIGLFLLAALFVSVQAVLLGMKTFHEGGHAYTNFNNYIIFKQAFFHLIQHNDLYILYPEEQWDLFKYSPAFALFMAPMAYLPDGIGLFCWNALNALVLLAAIRSFPLFTEKQRNWFIAFIFIEMITALQNAQSNALIAGLIMLSFSRMEQGKTFWATCFIVITVFIKLFGIVGFALFLLYPNKWKAALYSIIWIIIFALIPLVVIPISELKMLYTSWLHMLQNDHDASFGFSVMGFLHTWFQSDAKMSVVIVGIILFCLPLIRIKSYSNPIYRALYVASVLIWIIIFNHKAESPTFIIAVCGIGIWYFIQPTSRMHQVLLALTFIFCILSPTDIIPAYIRTHYAVPYVWKVVPCILVWLMLVIEQLRILPSKSSEVENHA